MTDPSLLYTSLLLFIFMLAILQYWKRSIKRKNKINTNSITDDLYKKVIDEIVVMCKKGQGMIGYNRVVNGVWNKNITKEMDETQFEFNNILKKLNLQDRKILAEILSTQVTTGAFETLKIMENNQIEPFTKSYEGSCFNDFIGRLKLINWEWPKRNRV